MKNTEQNPLSTEEIELLAEEDYWHTRAQEEADYFAQIAMLQDLEE
jgi:hypothetical protein